MKKKETEFGHQCIDRLFESSNIVIKTKAAAYCLALKEYIGDKYLILSEYIKNNKLTSSFCIVLKEQEHPALSIEHENLLFLSMLNARIDFDFI